MDKYNIWEKTDFQEPRTGELTYIWDRMVGNTTGLASWNQIASDDPYEQV